MAFFCFFFETQLGIHSCCFLFVRTGFRYAFGRCNSACRQGLGLFTHTGRRNADRIQWATHYCGKRQYCRFIGQWQNFQFPRKQRFVEPECLTRFLSPNEYNWSCIEAYEMEICTFIHCNIRSTQPNQFSTNLICTNFHLQSLSNHFSRTSIILIP